MESVVYCGFLKFREEVMVLGFKEGRDSTQLLTFLGLYTNYQNFSKFQFSPNVKRLFIYIPVWSFLLQFSP